MLALTKSILALGGAAAMLATLALPAMAAPRPLTMDVSLDGGCATGLAKPNTVIKVVFRDALGASKGQSAMITNSDGSWQACTDFFSDGILAGDKIRVTDYDTDQTLKYTVPRITLGVNRTTDVVSGVAPAGLKLAIEVVDFSGPIFGHDPYDVTRHVTADGSGAYSHDFGTDGIDLMAGALVDASTTAHGGAITARREMAVPGLFLTLGEASFGGYIRQYHHIRVSLKHAGSPAATGDAVGDDFGQFSGKFIDTDGAVYPVQGGESLNVPALGISWQIPNIDATVNTATDKVSGTCFANSPYVVVVGLSGFFFDNTGPSGSFTVDFTSQSGIAKGDLVLIACLTHAGDQVEQLLTAN